MELKFLVVDDSIEKIRGFLEFLQEIGVHRHNITTSHDAFDARAALRSGKYDILILDIAIPERVEEFESIEVGLDLLSEISEREEYYSPDYIICVTALEEGINELRTEFYKRHWQLVEYKNNPDVWKSKIRDAALYLRRQKEMKIKPGYNYDVLIFCALATPELSNILQLPYNWSENQILNGTIIYRTGIMEVDGEVIRIVASHAPSMGMVATVFAVTQLLEFFKPRLAVMSGICAGFEKNSSLGDIVIADPIWDYQTGKLVEQNGSVIQDQEIKQVRLGVSLAGKLHMTVKNTNIPEHLEKGWTGDNPDTRNKIRIGSMVSGAAVVASETVMETISRQDRKILALDMEAYGFMYACENYVSPPPTAFVVKSVVDFGDSGKSNQMQQYGSYVSARFLDKFLNELGADIRTLTR